MKFIMFTKHLEGLSVPEISVALNSVGVTGADLCVREGYPVNPSNITKALPEAVKIMKEEGLSIPLVTSPGDFNSIKLDYVENYFHACGENGVKFIKLGYWHWKPNQDYWKEIDRVRKELEGFEALSAKTGVKTIIHNHSGHSMGLNSSAMMHVIKGFDPKNVGVFGDVGHLSICGEPIDMALNIVKDYLAVMSFKDLIKVPILIDNKRSWSIDVVRLGTGFADWKQTLTTLQNQGFVGPVSMHSEYGGVPVDTVIDLARMDLRFIKNLMEA